jgi:predicted short-subunit dehydrogenase-like oxidoreductase (DUF2520 family)
MKKATPTLPRRRTTSPPTPSVTVIGLGNWGSSLVAGLSSAGIHVGEVVVRSKPARSPRGLNLTTLGNASLEASIFWLCVPDGAIAETSAALIARLRELRRSPRDHVVVHSSGALSVEVLQAAAAAGAKTASVAPVMTFPTRRPVSLAGVPFAVESSAALRPKFFALVRKLGGAPFRIESRNKVLYHASAVMASPLLLSGLVAAHQTAILAGLSPAAARGLLAPMAAATIRNFVSRGSANSFSGPIARGDIATVELHLHALQGHPMLVQTYRSLTLNALEYLPSRKREEIARIVNRGARKSLRKLPPVRD